MGEEIHAAAIRRITRILNRMSAPGSPLRAMYPADRAESPTAPPALDTTHADAKALARYVQQGRIDRVGRSLYIERPEVEEDGGHEQYELSLLTEVRRLLGNGQSAPTISHSTAALLHGAWTFHVPRLVHVTYAVNRHVVGGIPVTTKERTLADCIRTLPTAAALVTCGSLFRRGADPREVDRLMSASKGKRGIVQARRILELCDPRSVSPGESVARLAAVDVGLSRRRVPGSGDRATGRAVASGSTGTRRVDRDPCAVGGPGGFGGPGATSTGQVLPRCVGGVW